MSSKYHIFAAMLGNLLHHIGRDIFVIFRSQVEKIVEHGRKFVEGKAAKKMSRETVENLHKIGNFTLKSSEEVPYFSKLILEYGYQGNISLDLDLEEEHDEFKATNPDSAGQTKYEAVKEKLGQHPEVTVEEYDGERHEIDNK